jgi:heterodisulfide reductase subunit A
MTKDKVGAVLVIGGGIAGMQSSLDIADSGFRVYLVEKKPGIGGAMSQLDKTFPTNDCAMCIMSPKLVAVGQHPDIQLVTGAELEKVEGEAGNFEVTLLKRPFRVIREKCTGCGICAQNCPVEAIDEHNEGLTSRTGIFIKYPQSVPMTFFIDGEKCIGCGVCQGVCKAEAIEYEQKEEHIKLKVGSIVLAPGFEKFDASLKKEYGYGVFSNVVTSLEFERILSASGPYRGRLLRPSDGEIPKKIAFIQCVGSRDEHTNAYCSSVCCMYSTKEAIIAKEHAPGTETHIFFMDMRAFGKEFDDYYKRAMEEGVHFTRCRVASIEEKEDKNLIVRYVEGGEPKEEEFNLVVLAVGLRPTKEAEELSKKLGIELNNYKFCSTKVFSPVETSRPGVLVTGAFASPKDIPDTIAQASGASAKATGIISSERGKLVTVKEYPPEMDASGEARIGVFICHCGINIGGVVNVPEVVEYTKTLPNVVYVENNLYTCSQDTQGRIRAKIKEHNLNRVIVASCTPRTHEPLFQNTCREAGLNPYLFEMASIREYCSWVHMHEKGKATEKAKDIVRMAVAKARLLEPLKRSSLDVTRSALIIGGGLSGMTAALELAEQGFESFLVEKDAELGGNLRHIQYLLDGKENPQEQLRSIVGKVRSNSKIKVYTNASVKSFEGYIGNFRTVISHDGKDEEIKHGVVIVATGGTEYKPKEYLYGKSKNVITQVELEQELAKGKLDAKTVVMIQCVGSRTKERPYCSRICCSEAIKNALKIKEINPDARVYVFYKDIRTYGFREDFYKEASSKGVIFIRYDDENLPEVGVDPNGKLRVTVKEPILDKKIVLEPDLLVLSAAILPHPSSADLAKILKVSMSKDKFFLEAHMKLRPVDFMTEGIFLCGLAHSPKFIDESISQSLGAVARACNILSKKKLESEALIAQVSDRWCSGCEVCISVCPYGARVMDEERGIAVVTEALCQGCGACAVACPSGTSKLRGYKEKQIFSIIDSATEA